VDTVVGLQVLEHLHRPQEFVRDCAEALRSGGALVLSTPNRPTFPEGNPWHVHEFDAPELRDLLASTFGRFRLLGVRHAASLTLLDRYVREPVQDRLVREGYEGQPAWLRAVLRTLTSLDFRLSERPDDCLDLFAVAAVR
jgi:SAM-dependent methyltransferase